jgi:hypothetical protein
VAGATAIDGAWGIVDEREATREKCSFTSGQAVAGIVGFVPKDEFALDERHGKLPAKRRFWVG